MFYCEDRNTLSVSCPLQTRSRFHFTLRRIRTLWPTLGLCSFLLSCWFILRLFDFIACCFFFMPSLLSPHQLSSACRLKLRLIKSFCLWFIHLHSVKMNRGCRRRTTARLHLLHPRCCDSCWAFQTHWMNFSEASLEDLTSSIQQAALMNSVELCWTFPVCLEIKSEGPGLLWSSLSVKRVRLWSVSLAFRQTVKQTSLTVSLQSFKREWKMKQMHKQIQKTSAV